MLTLNSSFRNILLEYKDFQYNKSKTKYMDCNFKKDEYNLQIKVGDVTSQVSKFKCLNSIIQNDMEIIQDATRKMQVRWLK